MEFRGILKVLDARFVAIPGRLAFSLPFSLLLGQRGRCPSLLFSFYADGVRVEFRGDPSMEGVGNVGLGWNSVGTVGEGFPIARRRSYREFMIK